MRHIVGGGVHSTGRSGNSTPLSSHWTLRLHNDDDDGDYDDGDGGDDDDNDSLRYRK